MIRLYNFMRKTNNSLMNLINKKIYKYFNSYLIKALIYYFKKSLMNL